MTPAMTTNPALAAALSEVDRHLAAAGWDQPPRLYALVKTADLVRTEPALAQSLGLPSVAEIPDDENLTPVEQETPQSGQPLDEWLSGIGWPAEVVGCVLAHEVLALPPSAEAEIPDAPDANPIAWASAHPQRREVRMLVGVLRDGSRASILRVRATTSDEPDDVVTGADLAPRLADALGATLLD